LIDPILPHADVVARTSTGALICASAHKIPLADKSVNAVVTSGPYFGLRKYHGEQDLVWIGGSYLPMTGATSPIVVPGPTTWEELENCEHDFSREFHPPGHRGSDTKPGKVQHEGNKNREKLGGYQCGKCGALRCGLGSEEVVEHFIWHLLLVLQEIKRVLRDDGVAWLNWGDSFSGSWGEHKEHHERSAPTLSKEADRPVFGQDEGWTPLAGKTGIPPGNLIGVPHRLMLAAQAAGWTVRNDAIWGKRSCMPESISGPRWQRHTIPIEKSKRANNPHQENTGKQGLGVSSRAEREAYFEEGIGASKFRDCPGCDKCKSTGGYILRNGSWRMTRSHEFVLMLTKGMNYYADSEAAKEPAVDVDWEGRYDRVQEGNKSLPEAERSGIRKRNDRFGGNKHNDTKHSDQSIFTGSATRNPRNVLYVEPTEGGQLVRLLNWLQDTHPEVLEELDESNRTPNTILRPAPSNYTGNHYAAFPSGLIEGLIRATTPRKCCPVCGAGYAPVIERTGQPVASHHNSAFDKGKTGVNGGDRVQEGERSETRLQGYRQTCNCPVQEPVAGIVLDPFVGSGTTLKVARELGVYGIGCDISREYLEGQAMDRALRVTPAKKIEELSLFSGKVE